MICNKCGVQLPENAKFCGKCGNNLTPPAPAEEPVVAETPEIPSVPADIPVVETPALVESVPVAPETPPAPKKKRSPVRLIIVLVAVLCAVAIGVGAILHFLPSEFQPLVEDVLAVEYQMDISGLKEMAPSQVWEKLEKMYNVSIDDLVSQEAYIDAAQQIYGMDEEDEKLLGKNIRYTVKVLKEYDFLQENRQRMLESLQEEYDISPSQVGEMRLVFCEVTLTGDRDTVCLLKDYNAIEIDGTWYLLNGGTRRFVAHSIVGSVVYKAKQADGDYDSQLEFDD